MMLLENLLYSVAGLVVGFVVGWWLRCYRKGEVPVLHRRPSHSHERPAGETLYNPEATIPTVIPAVSFDPTTGEPLIAREQVQRESPIPRSVTILIILLAALSLVYIAVSKSNEAHDAKVAQARLARQVAANEALVLQLQHQQGIVDSNEKRLEDLVLAISTAKTPGEVSAAIHRFLVDSASARARERRFKREHGGTGVAPATPSGDTRGSQSPKPKPQSSRSPSNSPSPRPSHSPRPSPSPSPSKTPSPKPPLEVCITTPLGKVCEPKVSLLLIFFLVR